MSKDRCIEIEINGTMYPFHFGMGTITKFSKMKKWDKDPAIEVALRLLTMAGSQIDQTEFHKIAAAAGAAISGDGLKPPKDSELEDNFFKIVNITQTDVYPAFMDELGIDARPMIDRMKNAFKGKQETADQPEPGKP
ncbi:MAG TPA: hypothetical protein PKH94_07290 [Bacteroidales bacterium]|nr:hypothetical protein [Bacteroidales bacterium]